MQCKCFEGHGEIYAREHKITVNIFKINGPKRHSPL